MPIKIGIGSRDLNLTPIILDIGVTVAVTLAEVALDPFTNLKPQCIMPQKLKHIPLPIDTPHSRSSSHRSFSRDNS